MQPFSSSPLTNKRALGLFLVSWVLLIQMSTISRPYSGHFSSYQANGLASIARNMLRENFSELNLPKTDMIVGGKRSLHLNAYPFPSLIAALGIKAFGGSLEFWGRFQAIFFNLLTIFLVGCLAAQWFHPTAAWAAASVYAFSPFALIYGQGFFFEPFSLFFLIFAIFLINSTDKELGLLRILMAGFFFSLSVTARLHFLSFLPASFLNLLWRKQPKIHHLFLFVLLALTLPLLWYGYTYFASIKADNVHTNLFVQAATRVWQDKPLLLSLPYYLRVFDIVSGVMLTPLLFPFLFLGFLVPLQKRRSMGILTTYLLFGSLVAILAPQKIMNEEFYLAGIFPFLSIAVGLGFAHLWEIWTFRKTTVWIFAFLAFYLVVSCRYFLHPIFKGSEHMEAVMQAAQFIQKNTNPDDFIIVTGNEPVLLAYYVDRPHWVLSFNSTGEEMRPYHKVFHFSGNNPAEIEAQEAAKKDLLSWVTYCRARGAKYLTVAPKEDLEAKPALMTYLNEHDQILSSDQDDFYLFRLAPRSLAS